jgi:predicted nucleic acid-binding protein
MSKAKITGQAINRGDGYIAAIAAARGLSVASRDVGPFQAAGVPVINPWATLTLDPPAIR